MDPVQAKFRPELTEMVISTILCFVQVLVSEYKLVFYLMLILKIKAKISPLLLHTREVILILPYFGQAGLGLPLVCFNIVSFTVSPSYIHRHTINASLSTLSCCACQMPPLPHWRWCHFLGDKSHSSDHSTYQQPFTGTNIRGT